MPVSLAEGEPSAGPWTSRSLVEFAEHILSRGGRPSRPLARREPRRQGPLVVAIDGRSGGGKSTLAHRLVQAVPSAEIVHTDDIAWFHSSFGWAETLVSGVLGPLAEGQNVSYRPPGWVQHDREGSIEVSASAPLVIIEGVGSSRRELGTFIDYSIWVQSDVILAETRGIRRDVETLGDAAQQQWRTWQEEEMPFLFFDKPWLRADVVVGGSDQRAHDRETDLIIAPPLR